MILMPNGIFIHWFAKSLIKTNLLFSSIEIVLTSNDSKNKKNKLFIQNKIKKSCLKLTGW